MKKLAIILIKAYKRYVSAVTPSTCRFYPTCSSYALEAIERYGFLRGIYLGSRRIVRCHPFTGGGYDPLD